MLMNKKAKSNIKLNDLMRDLECKAKLFLWRHETSEDAWILAIELVLPEDNEKVARAVEFLRPLPSGFPVAFWGSVSGFETGMRNDLEPLFDYLDDKGKQVGKSLMLCVPPKGFDWGGAKIL